MAGSEHNPSGVAVSEAKSKSEVVALLRSKFSSVPRGAVILGSGLDIFNDLIGEQSATYAEIFGVAPSIAGHSGSISVGKLQSEDEAPIAILRGRFHLYEGHDWSTVTLPAAALVEWGVPELLITNAAGGVNAKFSVGDVMIIDGYRDHLNPELRKTGLLPALRQAPTDVKGQGSDRMAALGERLRSELKLTRRLQRGVYAGLHGPTYETNAEIFMLRCLGADAVGMSTVPELEAIKGTASKALALSVITNVWGAAPMGGHEEVMEEGRAAGQFVELLLRTYLTTG